MPKEGPAHPNDMVMRIAALVSLSFRKSFMTSEALSVTVSIVFSPSGDAMKTSMFLVTYT